MSRVNNGNRNQIELLIRHDQMQAELLAEFCSRRNLPFRPGAGLSHWCHLKLLVAHDRTSDAPTARQACWRFLRSVWGSRGELTLSAKTHLTAWALSTTLLPGSAGRSLVRLAFSRSHFFPRLNS